VTLGSVLEVVCIFFHFSVFFSFQPQLTGSLAPGGTAKEKHEPLKLNTKPQN